MTRKVIRPILALTRDDLLKVQPQADFAGRVSLRQVEAVWQQLQKALEPAVCYRAYEDGHIEVCATLGGEIDEYLAQAQVSGRMLDALLADRLCMKLLLKLYQVLEDAEGELSGKAFSYAFPEDPDVIGSILDHTGADVRQNDSGLMIPLKSTAYLLYPVSGSAGEPCSGICGACGSRNCPYAGKQEKDPAGAFKYSYGYQRIFGTMPKDEKEHT